MTAALHDDYPRPGEWTTDDRDRLPDRRASSCTRILLAEPWEIDIPLDRITPRSR